MSDGEELAMLDELAERQAERESVASPRQGAICRDPYKRGLTTFYCTLAPGHQGDHRWEAPGCDVRTWPAFIAHPPGTSISICGSDLRVNEPPSPATPTEERRVLASEVAEAVGWLEKYAAQVRAEGRSYVDFRVQRAMEILWRLAGPAVPPGEE